MPYILDAEEMRFSWTTVAAAIVALAGGASCTRSSVVTFRDPVAPRATDAPLAIYAGAERPSYPYDELGAVEVKSSADAFAAMGRATSEARALGADAVIVLRDVDQAGGDLPAVSIVAIAVRARGAGAAATKALGPPLFVTSTPSCATTTIAVETVEGAFPEGAEELRRRGARARADAVVVTRLEGERDDASVTMTANLVTLDCGRPQAPDAVAARPAPAPTARIALETRDGLLQHRYVPPTRRDPTSWSYVDESVLWEPICKAPCIAIVDAHQTFDVGGPGRQESDPFHVRPGDDVVVRGRSGKPIATYGMLAVVVGIVEAALGGVMYAVVSSKENLSASDRTPALVMIGGGLAVAAIGLPIWLANRTSLEVTSTPAR